MTPSEAAPDGPGLPLTDDDSRAHHRLGSLTQNARALGIVGLMLVVGCNRSALAPDFDAGPGDDASAEAHDGPDGGEDAGPEGLTPDGAPDGWVSACDRPPRPCPDPSGQQCAGLAYGEACSLKKDGMLQVCFCDGPLLYCNDCHCSPRPQDPGGSYCEPTGNGVGCFVSFEGYCHCVLPEHQWQCCGGVRTPCQFLGVGAGQPCPGPGCVWYDPDGACHAGGQRCTCDRDHWRCTPLDGGTSDGG